MKTLLKISISIALTYLGFSSLMTAVQAQVPASGRFVAQENCEATPAIRKPNNPGKVSLGNGRSYEVMGFNSPQREFIQIMIPEANPNLRWVSTKCGEFRPFALDELGLDTTKGSKLLPFFDNTKKPEMVKFPNNRSVDVTPPPPPLDNFDKAVLRACGPIGSASGVAQLQELFRNFPGIVTEIKGAVGGELMRGRRSNQQFTEDLIGIWTANRGFEHIFCGQIKGRTKIGGLHFAGRYLELQNTQRGGRLDNNNGNEEVVEGSIYTLGVVIVDANGNIMATDTVKGYGYPSSAKNIFIDATRAFKNNPRGGACLLPVKDPETGESFRAVFVKSSRGIITFYPDATPSGQACQ
jgi:hypothetical protein